jgi:hypothetical protein
LPQLFFLLSGLTFATYTHEQRHRNAHAVCPTRIREQRFSEFEIQLVNGSRSTAHARWPRVPSAG